jgi:serine phosphatase RsbU (regulator of sigma subunit)/CHASE3 domain sensor protein
VGGFGLLLLLVLVLGWVTLSLFGSLQSVQRRVFDDAIPGLVTVDEIVRSYTAQSAAARGYLISAESSLLDQYHNEVAESRLWQNRGAKLFTRGQEQRLLDNLVASGAAFQKLVDEQVIPLAAAGNRSQAFRVLGQDGSPLISQIETLGGLLRQTQDDVVRDSETSVRSNSNRTVIILLLALAGTFAIGVVVAVILPKRLADNINRLVEAARAIGRGDLEMPIAIESGDELEELAIRMTEMQGGLKRLQQLALQDRELEIAASIQRNLLQRVLPEAPEGRVIPLQRQANLVGGDWYDVDLAGKTLTVVVGDASGKGIAAALMATVALSALRAERGMGSRPHRIVEHANQALKDATDSDAFTTLVYMTVDLARGELKWMNMGHPSPFLLKAVREGEPTQGYFLEGPRNRALGWFDDPGFQESVVSLTPGDRLLLYTDGFLEAKAPDGEVFGEHRLAQALLRLGNLQPDDIADHIVRDVEKFAAGKLDDDLTMLVIDYQGSPLVIDATAETMGEEAWRSRK